MARITRYRPHGLLGRAIAHGIRGWMAGVRYRVVFEQPELDPALGIGGPRIYVVWHEYLLAPIYMRAGCRITILVSKHRDADLLESIARHSGYGCVRGSTARGGAGALKALVAEGRQRHLVLTPDGPRGPRRRMASGPVYLASKLGMPIVPMGFAFDHSWRLSSWDRFVVPRPLTTARAYLGSPIHVPGGLDRTGLEAMRLRVESALNDATETAEGWAAEKRSPPEAIRTHRIRRADPPAARPAPAGSGPINRAA